MKLNVLQYMKKLLFLLSVSTQLILSSQGKDFGQLNNAINVKKEITEKPLLQSDVSVFSGKDVDFIDKHNCSYSIQIIKTLSTIPSCYGDQKFECIDRVIMRCDGKQTLPCKILGPEKSICCMSKLLGWPIFLKAVLQADTIAIKKDTEGLFFAFKLKHIDQNDKEEILKTMKDNFKVNYNALPDTIYGSFI